MEDHYLVQAVYKFRRELATSGLDLSAFNLLIEVGPRFVIGLDEAVAARHQFGDFATPQVGGHKDDGLREVYAAIIAKGQCGLVQHAEEQLPQGVAGFFDFVKEQERQLELVGM